MGDYTNMSGYYDLIMTSGYYDYPKIVDALMASQGFQSVLEIGCGTGLILEELAKRNTGVEITGFDLTQAMLNIAEQHISEAPLRRLVIELLTENAEAVQRHSAAAQNHHAFIGGYLEHTLSVTKKVISTRGCF